MYVRLHFFNFMTGMHARIGHCESSIVQPEINAKWNALDTLLKHLYKNIQTQHQTEHYPFTQRGLVHCRHKISPTKLQQTLSWERTFCQMSKCSRVGRTFWVSFLPRCAEGRIQDTWVGTLLKQLFLKSQETKPVFMDDRLASTCQVLELQKKNLLLKNLISCYKHNSWLTYNRQLNIAQHTLVISHAC